ncbi:hypothetical protein LSTR_LSTR017532 [Laodelphax striatellus]|uniref:Uncharacterized protein n=1 Tax=Laodelphax striatellus TaxID=195883 RepID=A0A482XJ28_LAOST|nr:hypothetical protein LSTR_LSTR017532 [Laodelphax striatellus]
MCGMNQDLDMRSIDPRMGPRVGDQDMRIPPSVPPMPPAPVMPPHRDAFPPQEQLVVDCFILFKSFSHIKNMFEYFGLTLSEQYKF